MIFFLDYRGFGKSEGEIRNQNQLFTDVQKAYNEIQQRYNENEIVVLGFSIGTCPAAKIAKDNNPMMLILQAPYYDLTGAIHSICPVIPDFLVKYKLETNKYIQDCPIPIVVFHGNKDGVIDYDNSLRLKENFKATDLLITLDGEGHNSITENPYYQEKLKELLNH